MQTVTLIIDKRRELSVKYKKLLENDYSKVIISKNLLTALKIIQDTEPDLILISDSIDSDLADYCKKIRALTYNMRPVIVALSKSSEAADRIKALDSGADDFISEPVNNDEFVMRVKAHLRREFETNLDNKSFLPNKKYSKRALKRTLSTEHDWAALYISIENFQNYKETYSELASDKLLKTYAAIITSTLNGNDYLGSVGDSSFLVITNTFKAEKIAKFLIFGFDMVVKKFYSQTDLERGYVMTHGDEQEGRRIGFMYTVIGIVTSETKKFKNVGEVMSSLANIHSLAKNGSKSAYMMDRAKISAENSVLEKRYNDKILIIENDESMILLLSTILNMQGYKVESINGYDEGYFTSQVPAVVIIDAGSDENGKGLDVCRLMKKDVAFENTRFIVTSIFHNKEKVLNAGADLYLPKPYEMSDILKWVERFVNEVNE